MQMPNAGASLNAKCKQDRSHALLNNIAITASLFLRNPTFLKAGFNAISYTRRNNLAKGVDIRAIHRLSERGLDDIGAETNQLIKDLSRAEILTVESSHERGGRACSRG